MNTISPRLFFALLSVCLFSLGASAQQEKMNILFNPHLRG